MNNEIRELQRRAGITPTTWQQKFLNGMAKLWKNIKGYAVIAWITLIVGWCMLWGKRVK